MSNRLSRWCLGIVLAASVAFVPSAWATKAPASGATVADVSKWMAAEANLLKSAPDIRAATDVMNEILEPLKRTAKVPATYEQAMATQANIDFSAILANPKTPVHVSLITIRILVELDQINDEAALYANLNNPNAAIRYWAVKGLTTLIPRMKAIPMFHELSEIQRDITSKGGFFDKETDPVVRAAMAKLIAALGESAGFVPLRTKLEQLAAKEAAPNPIARAELDSAATLMDCIAELSKTKVIPPADANLSILAASAVLAKHTDHLKQRDAAAPPLDSDLTTGLKNEYLALKNMVGKISTKKISFPAESDDAGKLFKAIEDANADIAKNFKP